MFFFFDIFINFNTTYILENGFYETSRRKIANNYLRSFFFIDLISALPLDKLITLTASTQSYNRILRVVKLPKLFSTLKMTKLFKISEFFKSLQINDSLRFQYSHTLLST